MTLRALFTAGALVTIGVCLSRVLGLLREMLLASHFGVGQEADMAITLLLIPDFITGALVGTAVGATFIPLFTVRDRESARHLFWQALAVSVGAFALLAVVVGSNASALVSLVTKGNGIMPGAITAFLIAISAIPLTAATAIFTAWLQYTGRFRVPAFASAIFNGVIVCTLWLMPVGLAMLAVSIFAGVSVRLLAHAYSFYRSEGKIVPSFGRSWQLNASVLKIYATTMATDICNLFPQFAPYYLIALGGSGLAIFNYAFRLSIMPAMIGYNVAQLVLLPWFARLFRERLDGDSMLPYSITLQCCWALCLAVCLSLMTASREAAQLCFGYGKMGEADIDRIGHLLALGVWSMPPILFTAVWIQMLYAHGKPRMPFIASIIQAVTILPLCWIGNHLYGLEGIMLAYASLQVIAVSLLSYAGHTQGIIARHRPSRVYGEMALLAIAIWAPLAWLYNAMAFGVTTKMLLAISMGMVVLVATVSLCVPVRVWALQKVKKI